MKLRLATRRSPLAQAQALLVQERLTSHGIDSELVLLDTSGDHRHDAPLTEIGGQGVFAVEIQRAVLDGEADVAVHSAKDLPSETPQGLRLASVPERKDVADVLVGKTLEGLGPGATVATGSPRRRALLLERRPDLHIVGLRGNMATRLAQAGRDGVDAIVTATAALQRLNEHSLITQELDPSWFIPQVGQGAIALEVRRDDAATREAVALINDAEAFRCLESERAFLLELGAGCSVPLGALARLRGAEIELSAVMAAADGSSSVRVTRRGHDGVKLGVEVARYLRDDVGGGDLLGWR
jgi:hydroxymethylbilane synthase